MKKFGGNPVGTHTTDSAESCANICSDTPDCDGFQFIKAYKTCDLTSTTELDPQVESFQNGMSSGWCPKSEIIFMNFFHIQVGMRFM